MSSIPPATIPERVFANLTQHGRRPFLGLLDSFGLCQQGAYAAVVQKTLNWVHLFRERGLKPGNRVLVILPHSLDLYVSYLGAVLAGIVPAMFPFPSPKLSKEAYFETIDQLILRSGAKLIVTYEQLASELRPFLEGKGVRIPLRTAEDLIPGHLQQLSPTPVQPDDVAFIQYSSGTTGLKKGVPITHRQLLWQVDAYAACIGLDGQDRIVSWLPLYHDMGLIACYWLPLITATPVIALSPFDWVKNPRILLEQVQQVRATLCWLPNFAYNHLERSIPEAEVEKYDLSCLRGVVNCSEPVMGESHERFYHKFRACGFRREALWTCYAMAENTFAVTSGRNPLELVVDAKALRGEGEIKACREGKRLVSSGKALPHTLIRIVDDQGKDLGEGKVGEIVIQSPCLMKGYDGAGEVLSGDFATGDIGFLSREELFVTGRKKDLIIIAGKNLYPQDIEAVVHRVAGVLPGRSVALGVSDEESGTEKLVVLAETHEKDQGKLGGMEQEIRARVATESDGVAAEVYLLPHKWLRKSSSGKIARAENLCRYLSLEKTELQKGAAQEGQETDDTLRARDILHLALGKEASGVALHQNLLTTGVVDSLSLVRLMLEVEKVTGRPIPVAMQRDVTSFETVGKIAAALPFLCEAEVEVEQVALMSERDKKAHFFSQDREGFDLVMIGSSRIDGLSGRLAARWGYRGFNFSVNSAMAEDWYCIMTYCLEHNKRPLKKVLLGIDIEALNGYYAPDKRLSACPVLRHYLDKEDHDALEGLFPADRGMAGTLKSMGGEERQRFQQMLTNLRHQDAVRHQLSLDYDPKTGDLYFMEEGVFKVAYEKRLSLCIEGLRGEADLGHQHRQMEMRLQGFEGLNPRRLKYLKRMVKVCAKKGVELICFLTPMHPVMKQVVRRRTAYEERVRDLRTLGIAILDFSEPRFFEGNDVDFRDEAHIGPFNSDRLLQAVLTGVSAKLKG